MPAGSTISLKRAPEARPTAAGVYLSGNGPLVRVLQDALKDAGGGGQTFVRAIKSYVDHYRRRASAVPPEHLIVFDEAQRAHDRAHGSRHEVAGFTTGALSNNPARERSAQSPLSGRTRPRSYTGRHKGRRASNISECLHR
ncbi:MAG: DNA/RNA helicase domain-containing protein [Steroidobacteraceae bacterium]